jgi:hypothetical protein
MANSFVLSTLLNTIVGVWYWTFMSSLNSTETHFQLHVFCVIAKTFYGSILSLPLSGVLEIVINRLMVWVMVFVLFVDALQLVIVVTNFNSYILTDALSVLFGIVFIFLDFFFIGECYNISSSANIEKRYCIPASRVKQKMAFNENLFKEDHRMANVEVTTENTKILRKRTKTNLNF